VSRVSPEHLAPPEAAGGAAVRPGFRPRRVFGIAGAHFVHDAFSAFLPPLLPLLIDKLSLSLALGGSLTLYQRLPMVLAPWLGALADRRDLRWFVITGPGLTALAMSLMGLAPHYAMLALLLLVAGISSAIFHTPAPVMIVRASGRDLGRGLSIYQLGGELARTLGPLAAVGAVSLWGLEGIWRLMPLGLASSFVLWHRFRRLPVERRPARRLPFAETWRDLRATLGGLAAVMLARSLLLGALAAFLPLYVQRQGGSLWLAGAVYSLYQLSGAGGALVVGTLSDRLGRRRVLAAALLVSPLVMVLFLFSHGWVLAPALILLGFTSLSTTPVMIALIQERRPAHPSTAQGLFTAVSFSVNAVMALVVGALADRMGLRGAFLLSAILALLALPALLLLPGSPDRTGSAP